MKYYACGNISGNKYKIEARRGGADSELMGIYDGYYDSRRHLFSLYRKTISMSAQPWDVPEKVKISAFEVSRIDVMRKGTTNTASAADALPKNAAPAATRKRLPRDVEGQIKIG